MKETFAIDAQEGWFVDVVIEDTLVNIIERDSEGETMICIPIWALTMLTGWVVGQRMNDLDRMSVDRRGTRR